MSSLNSKHFPVSWVKGKILFDGLSKKEDNAFFGICGYSKRVFRITPVFLEILVVEDLIINEIDDKCEEGERCLDFDCKYNRTTKETLARSYRLDPKKFGNFKHATVKWNRNPKGGLLSFERYFPSGKRVIAVPSRKKL